MSVADPNSPLRAARHARQLYLRHLAASADGLAQKLQQQLSEPTDSTSGPTTAASSASSASGSAQLDGFSARQDLLMQLRQLAPDWVGHARRALEALAQKLASTEGAHVRVGVATAPSSTELSLMTDEMVEARILAARMALVVADKGSGEFNDLRLRLQHLEKTDLDEDDPVRAGVFVHLLVQAWLDAGLTREHWQTCQSLVTAGLIPVVVEGWHDANRYLLEQGVLPNIDLRQLVRRTGSSQPAGASTRAAAASGGATAGGAAAPKGSAKAASPALGALSGAAAASVEVANRLMRFLQDNLPAGARRGATAGQGTGPGKGQGTVQAGGQGAAQSAATDNAAFPATEIWNIPTIAVDWSTLASSAQGVRQQVRALKAASSNEHDKAVIEVVALIFENILAEERIPPSVRVWFARLQMPVLRIAVIDPEFLSSPEHPARLLIDRMGSCVLGFDSAVSLEPLEQEIRRIVQVIEQYPETGRRVFELMHHEFNDFLSRHLHTDDHVGKVVNLAKQVEQKETLTVKYTIELRKLLSEVAVRDEVRDFLFQVWVEVLAFATVKYGAQHEQSLALRNVASELLWAASAKSSRGERAKVIGRLPALLGQLREGMQLLGFDSARQEAQIQRLSDALTDAFMSRTQPIDSAWLNGLTQALAGLEDYLGDLETGYHSGAEDHFELSADSIELITGVDASAITVLPDTPQSREAVTPESVAAARQLVLGAWYDLEHNGQRVVVQLVWRSGRHQLYLLARPPEQSFLMQAGRLAHYLQVGLLRSCEAEPLTTRATRDALDKLSANPERLLA
jgi:hypothetical protein